MPSESQSRRDIVEVGRRIWLRGYVAANDGNISIRMGPDEFLATPTGVSKGFMTPEMLIKVDGEGKKIDGELQPSTEMKMHLAVYRERPDVNAVVHAHPPISTAFAVAGIPLAGCVLPEVIISLGNIPLAEYGTPSTEEVPAAVGKYVKDHNALLLESHGALTLGGDVYAAYHRMETVEHFAAVSLAARQLGGERELTPSRIRQLLEVREKLGMHGVHPGCPTSGAGGASVEGKRPSGLSEEELRGLVVKIVSRVMQELR